MQDSARTGLWRERQANCNCTHPAHGQPPFLVRKQPTQSRKVPSVATVASTGELRRRAASPATQHFSFVVMFGRFRRVFIFCPKLCLKMFARMGPPASLRFQIVRDRLAVMIQDQIERHTGSLQKLTDASSLDRRNMDEHVMAPIVGNDEAETPGGVERLHSPARHVWPPCDEAGRLDRLDALAARKTRRVT
jgi:hypothetical protein